MKVAIIINKLTPEAEAIARGLPPEAHVHYLKASLVNPSMLAKFDKVYELCSTPKPAPKKVDKPPVNPKFKLEITREDLYNAQPELTGPTDFQLDGCRAILEESDYYKKKAMFSQIFPDEEFKSKKAINSFCKEVIQTAGDNNC